MRSSAFILAVQESEYLSVRSWTSREAWLCAVRVVLDTPEAEVLRRRISIRRSTFLRFCEVEAESAHRRNGRHVATSHETLAARVGMSKITARRARQLMALLDCSVTLRQGRYLTTAERLAATAVHGGQQLRAASVRALTIPRNVPAQSNEHLASSPSGRAARPVLKSQPRRGKPHSEAASRPLRRRKGAKFVPGSDRPRPLALLRFADELVRRMPWLSTDEGEHHRLHVCNIVQREAFDFERYSAADLIDMWTAMNRAQGRESLPSKNVKNPLGYLRQQVKAAREWADVVQPRARAAEASRISAERRARLARQAAERAAEAERRASIDDEQVDAIIAQMRAEMAAEAAARRRSGRRRT
ncbi:hypothetical protein C5E16_14275 [Clavibacter michiganensis]|uniref:Replication protein n=1 Tax=Clavibacter michiganensis TaxID=28447 RepID=A0A2S5VNS6_9MICO|nr:hypothetical protein [Clavibacter michiganensis]PPF64722.1 hypothetical protein C5E16_14275 [Clavibacter michiganensis]